MTEFGNHSLSENVYNNFLGQSKNGFLATDKFIGKLNKSDNGYNLLVFSTRLEITEKIKDIDTQTVKVRLRYYDGKSIAERIFASDIFTRAGTKTLCDYGIRFLETRVGTLIEYLAILDSQAPLRLSFSRLGFDSKGAYFKGYKAIGTTEPMQYSGELKITPKGSLDVWKAMVKNDVLNSVPLTFVLCCGFASPVLQLLNFKNDLGSIFFNLANKSSTGKTTAEMLAVSAFSNPNMNSGTLISFNGTEQSILEFISNCQGFTVALDEYGMSLLKNPSQFFYSVCSGRGKMRLSPEAKQREVKKYSSVILSSAEFQLLDSGSPDGVRARMFEPKDALTSSAEQADNIKRTVKENYAVACEPFILFLLTKRDVIQEEYAEEISRLLKISNGCGELTKRIFSKFAVITLTAEYIKQALSLNINVDSLRTYAANLEKQTRDEKTPEQHLLEIIQEDVMLRNSRYSFDKTYTENKGYGLVLKEKGFIEYYITKPIFKELCLKNKIQNYNAILEKLKKDNILICEGDRKTIRKVVVTGMNKQVCYGFRVPDDSEPEKVEAPKNTEPRRIIQTKGDFSSSPLKLEDFNDDDIDIELNQELFS